MSNDWKDGRRDYGDGWTATHDAVHGDFGLDGPNDQGIALDGTPADCDLLHACLVALRERPEVLRAALGVGGEARGRTVRAKIAAVTAQNERWAAVGWHNYEDNSSMYKAFEQLGYVAKPPVTRPQWVDVELLLPEEPPTVVGRVEAEP